MNDAPDMTGSGSGSAHTIPGRLSKISGPGWLAATGATLLLVAAVVVVAGQWSTIGPTARFAGLVGAIFAVFFAAESARTRVPTTATALAVLAACITAPVGIAAVAALQGEWPLCIAIGGAAALIACELQSRRWRVRTLKAATVGAAVLLIAGAAPLTGVPAAVLGALASVAALALGAERRSIALALLVPAVPVLWLLADKGIGPGVLARMGVIGVGDWVVPVSTLIAGLSIAVTAHRRDRRDLAAAAVVVLCISGAAALIETVPPLAIWLSVPAGIATLIAIASLPGDISVFSRWARQLRTVVATTLATASWFAPILIVVARTIGGDTGVAPSGQLLLPAAASLGALLLLAATVDRDLMLDDIIRLGCVAGGVAVVAASDVGIVWVAVASLGLWIATTASTSWRSWIATSSLHATWAVLAVIAAEPSPSIATVLIVLAAGIVVAASFAAGDQTLGSVAVPIPVSLALVLLAFQWPDDLSVLAAAVGVAAAVATGIAMLRTGFTAVDSLALTLGGGAGAIALGTNPAGISLAITLLGTQLWIYGVAFRRTEVAAGAASFGLLGLLSLWQTSGTNDLVIEWIAPYGADGQDLALGVAGVALLGGGLALRLVQRPSTWLAYSPGLSLIFTWLLIAQGNTDAAWATFGGLLVGVVATGIGGVRRLAAPLVLGTVGLIATGVISIGSRLASAPTWTWIAVGGAGLLSIAALLERSERPLLSAHITDEEHVESLAEVFSRRFE